MKNKSQKIQYIGHNFVRGAKKMIEGLAHLLADTYIIYVKAQNFHWNVTGPHFLTYHQLFEQEYKALAQATDVLAERIRALQAKAPASLTEFLKLSSLKEAANDLDADDMLRTLLSDHELIAKMITRLIVVAEESGDEVTADILIERQQQHNKSAWMLRSTLGYE